MSIYAWIAAIIVACTLLVGAYWKGRVDESAKTSICEARGRDKDAIIESQNDSIQSLRRQGAAKMAAGEKALKVAQANTAAHSKEIAETLALQPTGDACAAAESLLGTVK